MTNTIRLQEPTADALSTTWTGLRLERGPNATNLAAFSLVALVPYVLGQTVYTVVDPDGATSDWYRAARYGPAGLLGTYSPAWPVAPLSASTGDGARRSLKNCRRMLARKLGGIQVVTTTADGSVDGSTLVSTGLATQTDPKRYLGWWTMPTDGVSAGQVRRVGESALNPIDGTLSVSPPMTSQIVRGTQVEMYKLLPPYELDGLLGLREALNMALAECWVLDRLAVPGQANTATYDVSELGDWLDPDAINEYYGPALGSGIPETPWGGFAARREGALVKLDVAPGIAAGAAMRPELTRPADTLIKVAGVWRDGQQGFTNDTDECLLQPQFLTDVALAYCYEALANASTGIAMAKFSKAAGEARRRAGLAKFRGLPHPTERPSHAAAAYGSQDWLGWVR